MLSLSELKFGRLIFSFRPPMLRPGWCFCSWFLDNPDLGWKPSQSLLDFMSKARADGKPLVYIGFGSIVVENPKAMTRSIVKAVLKSKLFPARDDDRPPPWSSGMKIMQHVSYKLIPFSLSR